MSKLYLVSVEQEADSNQLEDVLLKGGFKFQDLTEKQFGDICAAIDICREADRQALKTLDQVEDADDVKAIEQELVEHEALFELLTSML